MRAIYVGFTTIDVQLSGRMGGHLLRCKGASRSRRRVFGQSPFWASEYTSV